MTITNQTKAIRKATVQRLAQVFRDSGVEYTSAAAVAHVLRDHILIRDAIECQWSSGTIALHVADELQREKYNGAELFTCRICKRPVPNGMACLSCTT